MGEIKEYTGISSPYEEPENPELILDTASASIETCVDMVLDLLVRREVVTGRI